MYFYTGKPMHIYSSVDNSSVFPKIRKARIGEWLGVACTDLVDPAAVPF